MSRFLIAGMPRARPWIVFLALVLPGLALAQEPAREDNFGPGTLQIRSQSPSQSLRLALPSVIPGDFGQGWSFMSGGSWTNVWSNEKQLLLDYEMADLYAAAVYGFGGTVRLGLYYDARLYFGGIMDKLIEGFHEAFGIDQDGRDLAESGKTRIVIRDAKGRTLSDISDVARMDNQGVGLVAQAVPFAGSRWLPAFGVYGISRFALENPTGEDDSDRLDAGFGVGLSKRLADRWYAYGSAG